MTLYVGSITVNDKDFVYVSTLSADASDDSAWMDNHFIVGVPRGVDSEIYRNVVRNILMLGGHVDTQVVME